MNNKKPWFCGLFSVIPWLLLEAISDVGVARAADEFAHEGVARHPFVGHINEVLKHTDQALCDGEVGGLVINFTQQGKRVFLHDGKLVGEHGVIDVIRAFLALVDPAEFACADAWPHREGLLGGGVAEFVVAHNAADEAQVGEGEGVMVIDVHLGLRGDEDLELGGLWNVDGHAVVEGVDAFDDDGLVPADMDGPAFHALAKLEVKPRQRDGLAVNEVEHVLVE